MGIVRGPIGPDNFTIVPNHWLRSPRLSYKAKGLLAAIASHQVGYRLTIKQLIAESDDGKDAIRAGLAELEAAGYLRRERTRSSGTGRLETYNWTLIEHPQVTDQGGKPDLGSDQDFCNETAGHDQSGFLDSGSDLGEDPKIAGQTQSAESAPKKTIQEDHVKKTIPTTSLRSVAGAPPHTEPKTEEAPTPSKTAFHIAHQTLRWGQQQSLINAQDPLAVAHVIQAALANGTDQDEMRVALKDLLRASELVTHRSLAKALGRRRPDRSSKPFPAART